MKPQTPAHRSLCAAVAALLVAVAAPAAFSYPVVSTAANFAITPPTSIPGVLEFTGPEAYFSSQQNQITGRANTGLSGPSVIPPPSYLFGSNYGMSIGYSGGSAGGTSGGNMSALIQGAAGIAVSNLSDSAQSITLSGTYFSSIITSNYTGDAPGLDLSPTGVGRGETGFSASVNGQSYLNVDRFVNTLGITDNVSPTWQFTFDIAPHTDALVDFQMFAAAEAISQEGSTPPLITSSLAPATPLPNPFAISAPEPASLSLFAGGSLLLLARRRRRLE